MYSRKNSQQGAGAALLLITALIWGCAFVAQSVAMDHVGPFTFCASRFLLSGFGKWDVDGHLVTVEVGVEARADEWVETDGAAFDELRLEGLDTKSMEGRSAVEKDWVLTDDFFDDVEDDWIVSIDVFVSLLVGGDIAIADQDRGDERT